MNIRRVKKRKLMKFPKDQQQLAKEKLFEISYFNDQKFVDQSQILALDFCHSDVVMESSQKLPTQIKNLIQKNRSHTMHSKTYQTIEAQKQLQKSIMHHRKMYKLHHATEFCIFNTIESNQVFVGNKLKESLKTKLYHPVNANYLVLDSKKRVSTLPSTLNQTTFVLKDKINTEPHEKQYIFDFQQRDLRKKKNKPCSTFYSQPKETIKNEFMQIKQKIRRDLFNKINQQ